MIATQSILGTWEKFNDFPMGKLTKVWFYNKENGKKQRDVSLMREHRQQYGLSGNCFDLAIWLLDEFKKDGVVSYPIGHNLKTENAHVAVIALNENGDRFLCDLGDQWIKPVLIDINSDEYTNEELSGFFPGAKVQVQAKEKDIEILYHRPNGKFSKQIFNTNPIEMDYLLQAAEFSQNLIKPKPLLECRIPYKSEVAHWEFYNWESFLSTSEGLLKEPKLVGIEEWVEKINLNTGFNKEILFDVLRYYKSIQTNAFL